ncbi:hypothetical protein A9Q89_07310 [Gammaproteobacteria bacterium 53_120_T64]|nr:hypothetical protein A9Q89_07310 [Gammaproteobacteria bacterium 53_120_T64]
MMIRRLPDALKQALLYGSSIALMKGISLLMLPYVAHHMSTEDFGRLEIIATLAIIASVLIGMGLDHTLFRFAGVCDDNHQRRRIGAEIYGLALLIGLCAWLLGWHGAPSLAVAMNGAASPYELRLMLSILALEGCISIPLAWLRMHNKASCFFLATTGRAAIQALLVVALLQAERGVAGMLEAGLIAAMLQALVLSYLQIRSTGLSLSRKTAWQALIYSLPLTGSGLVAFTLNGLDRWILAQHNSLDEVALFSVAAKFSLPVVLLLQPFSMWWAPRRFAILKGHNGQQRTANFIALGLTLALIIGVMVGLCAPLVIHWLMPANYADSSRYVIGLVTVLLLKEMTELVNLGCLNGETTGIQLLINTAAAAVGLLLMLWWTPLYGVWGVIGALLCAQALRLILFFKISQRLLPLPYPTHSVLLLGGISFAWLSVALLSKSDSQQVILIIVALSSLLVIAKLRKLIVFPAHWQRSMAGH